MTLPNSIWSLGFVSDALSDGRRFRILCIVDDFSAISVRRRSGMLRAADPPEQ